MSDADRSRPADHPSLRVTGYLSAADVQRMLDEEKAAADLAPPAPAGDATVVGGSMQDENRSYSVVSSIMQTKYDTVKNSISNVR